MRSVFPRRTALMVPAAALAAIAVGAASAPAQAAADPELSAVSGLLAGRLGTSTAPDLLAPRLVSSADAAARMVSLLPNRSINAHLGTDIAIDVLDVATGEHIWGKNATDSQLPASNMKIVTAVNALSAMGPDKRFTTTVNAAGRGSVVLVGGGDATLTSANLSFLARTTAQALKAQGLLPPVVTHEPYRPSVCRIGGKLVRDKPSRPCPLVTPAPSRDPVQVYVDDSLYGKASRGPGWTGGYMPSIVRPVRPLGRWGRYVSDSGRDAADYFAARLKNYGVAARWAGRTRSSAGTALASYESMALSDQVRAMLQPSDNNIAEMLYRNTAIAMGYPGTWAGASQAAAAVLASLGVPTDGLVLSDGSGVSRSDRLTPVALTAVLQRVADRSGQPKLESIYYGGGLPTSGESGTLSASAGRYVTAPSRCARGKILAKTGTLFDTIALSGLTVGQDGQLKAFSILVNDRVQRYSPLTVRREVDKIAATVTGCW